MDPLATRSLSLAPRPRRGVAGLLLLLLSFLALAPALFPSPQSQLPACCRRDGKHHCAKSNTAGASTPQISQAACPLFQPGAATSPAVDPATLPPPAEAPISLQTLPAPALPAQGATHASNDNLRPPRGPPSLLR